MDSEAALSKVVLCLRYNGIGYKSWQLWKIITLTPVHAGAGPRHRRRAGSDLRSSLPTIQTSRTHARSFAVYLQ